MDTPIFFNSSQDIEIDTISDNCKSIATSLGFPTELRNISRIYLREKENGDAHGNKTSESHKPISLYVV